MAIVLLLAFVVKILEVLLATLLRLMTLLFPLGLKEALSLRLNLLPTALLSEYLMEWLLTLVVQTFAKLPATLEHLRILLSRLLPR